MDDEFSRLTQAHRDLQRELRETMTPDQRHAAEATFRLFLANKPNPPDHADYMARAVALYPKLPAGAAQSALHCLETLGKGYAKRYATNASARQSANERALMGTTLAAYRASRADKLRPYHFEGVMSPSRRRELKAVAARYAEYMAESIPIVEREQAASRKVAFARYAASMAAVGHPVSIPA